jgi:hypothetical protein
VLVTGDVMAGATTSVVGADMLSSSG